MPAINSFFVTLLTLLASAGVVHAQTPAQRIVIQNYYYARPGKSDEVYRLRLHASEVRASLGLPRGRVLHRLADSGKSGPGLPDVIWECEYPSAEARQQDVTALSHSDEFKRIEQRMDRLVRRFQGASFEIGADK